MRRRPTRPLHPPIALAGLALLVALGGCGGDDGEGGGTTTTLTTTATTATTTSTTTTVPTTTTMPAPTEVAPTPAEAAARLVAAWQAGDRAAAGRIARPEAVAALFAQPADGFALYGCDSGEFETSTCNYRNRATGGYAQITAAREGDGWVVASATVSVDG